MNWRNNFLGQLLGGDTLKDYQHAARLYTDDMFRLAPKTRFLYHVVFEFAAGSAMNGNQRNELGMIVKRCDLPQYSFNVEMRNQYNFKNYVTTGVTYQPVNITLHDDMGDVAVAFFRNYYGHYFQDTNVAENIYYGPNGNTTNENTSKYRWGRDAAGQINGKPMFNSISIFQLNRQRFTEYKMMNPIITDYNNGGMDQTDGTGINEHVFSVSYSGVKIEAGAVGRDNPQGFATFHYDNTPSPNSPLGGGADSIFGVAAGVGSAMNLFKEGNILGAALAAGNTYDKIKSGRALKGSKEEIIGIAKESIKKAGNNLGATSKPGIRFPKNERRKSAEAKLVNSNSQTLLGSSKQTKPKAVENLAKDLSKESNSIKLTPNQISLYLGLDTVAKDKFAKFYSFRADKNLQLDTVETEWAKLTDTQKQTYKDKAVTDAINLVEQGVVSYNVDQDTYNQILSAQVIS